jgi:hypothetical protein
MTSAPHPNKASKLPRNYGMTSGTGIESLGVGISASWAYVFWCAPKKIWDHPKPLNMFPAFQPLSSLGWRHFGWELVISHFFTS